MNIEDVILESLENKKEYSPETLYFFKNNPAFYQQMSHTKETFVDGFFAGVKYAETVVKSTH